MTDLTLFQWALVLGVGAVASFIGASIQYYITARRIRRRVDAFVDLLEGRTQPH